MALLIWLAEICLTSHLKIWSTPHTNEQLSTEYALSLSLNQASFFAHQKKTQAKIGQKLKKNRRKLKENREKLKGN